MPVTLLLVPRIQNAIYTLFHPIQTKGADYAHHNTTSPPTPDSKCKTCFSVIVDFIIWLPKVLVTVSPISTMGGADYAHHNTMGLVWLKFNVAPLCMVSI